MCRFLAVLGALLLTAAAAADVVTLTNGRQVEGKIVGEADDRIVLEVGPRMRLTLRRSRIRSIQRAPFEPRTSAKPVTSTKPATLKPPAPRPAESRNPRVYVLQIAGPVASDLLVSETAAALQAAKRLTADVLLVELDTPGGRLDVTTTLCNLLEQSKLKTAAWIPMGKHRGAFSAGALLSLACDRIYMAPGASVGSATPFTVTAMGAAEVSEKVISATSAMARGLASRHGHSPEIAAAMVDPDVALREVTADGRTQCVTADRAAALARQGAKLGRWVSKKGKLLALTAEEAEGLGLAAGIAETRAAALEALGMPDARIVGGKSGEAIAKKIAARDEKLAKLDAAIAAARAKAMAADPNRTIHRVWEGSGGFTDRGRAWRKQTDAAVAAWDACLTLCRAKLDYARKYPGLGIGQNALKAAMIEIKQYRDQLARDRNRKGLPTP